MAGHDVGELVATKLQAPTVPRHFVRRARLDDLVGRAIEERRRLILVSAPAGSGKSTLLAGSLGDRDADLAWLQVEDSDADPVRFWSYLVAAIGRIRPGITETVVPTIVSSGGSPDGVVTALVNALAELTSPLVVVIDDYHVIDNPGVHAGVERLIELCPEHVRIVIATRADPSFRLGRLRVRGQLTEIRAADLRFDPDEAADLLAPSSLDGQMLGELCDRTEGWAAGLVLAGLSLTGLDDAAAFITGFRGDDQLVVDYLTDELLASIPPEPELLSEARSAVDRCADAGIVGPALARIEARHGLATPTTAQPGRVEELTDRELAVLRHLPTSMSQREIAAELYVSLNTVKTHCKAIYRKLGVGDRTAAVNAARRIDVL